MTTVFKHTEPVGSEISVVLQYYRSKCPICNNFADFAVPRGNVNYRDAYEEMKKHFEEILSELYTENKQLKKRLGIK